MPANYEKKRKFRFKKPLLIAAVLLVGLAIPLVARAWLEDLLFHALLGSVIHVILRALSALFNLLVAAFIAIIQYDFQDFIGGGTAIDTVWQLVRDLSNMFFIIALLVIAFAAMLKIESYKWSRLLPKLLGLAILINFSKTIALVILDAGQILMMTFVRAFQDIAVDNITSGLMMDKIWRMGTAGGLDDTLVAWATQVLMIFMMIIATLVMVTLVILLIIRIVIIWFLVAVSPVAFMGYVLPATRKHASRWWGTYTKLVMLGPMLAFFLWFCFIFMSRSLMPPESMSAIEDRVGAAGFTEEQYLPSEALTPGNIFRFLLAIILLIVGTGMAIQAAEFGGNIAGAVWKGGTGALKHGVGNWLAKGGRVPDWMKANKKIGGWLDKHAGEWGKGRQGLGGWLARRGGQLGKGLSTALQPITKAREGLKAAGEWGAKGERGVFGKMFGGLAGGLGKGLGAVQWKRIAPALTPYFWQGWQEFRQGERRKARDYAFREGLGTAEDWGSPTRFGKSLKRTLLEERDEGVFQKEKQRTENLEELKKNNVYLFANNVYEERKNDLTALEGAETAAIEQDFAERAAIKQRELDKATTPAEAKRITAEIGDLEPAKEKEIKARHEFYDQKRQEVDDEKNSRTLAEQYQDGVAYLEERKSALENQRDLIGQDGRGALFLGKEIATRNLVMENLLAQQANTLRQLQRLEQAGLKGTTEYQAELDKLNNEVRRGLRERNADQLEIKDGDAQRAGKWELGQINTQIENKQAGFEMMKSGSEAYGQFNREFGSKGAVMNKANLLLARINELDKFKTDTLHRDPTADTSGIDQQIGVLKKERADLDKLVTAYNEFVAAKFAKAYQFSDLDYADAEGKIDREGQIRLQEDLRNRQQERGQTQDYLDNVIGRSLERSWTEADQQALDREIMESKQKQKKISQRMIGYRRRGDYARRAALQQSVMEEFKKIEHIENSEELQGYYNSAVAQHDIPLALAAARKLTETYNLNDIINDHDLPANWYGLMRLVNDDLIGKLGLDPQLAYGFQNDLSYMAEDRNHWTYARTITADRGSLRQQTETEQAISVAAELFKRPGRDLAGALNRLGYGGEDPRTGRWEPSLYAYPVLTAFAPDYAYAMRRGEMNKNAQWRILQRKDLFEGIEEIWQAKHPEYPRELRRWGQLLEQLGPRRGPEEQINYYLDRLNRRGFRR